MGRHQNPYEEVNLEEAQRRGLPVLRRLSGGGTVFHDLGNINFTFILPVKDGRQIDFRRALTPVIQALHEAGADVRLAGRSDLTLAGRKVSGNAMYTWQDRCLHHGTLLYKADLDALDGLLRVPLHDYRSRSIKSIRSLVTNISEHMETPPETTDFMRTLAVRLAEYAGEQDEPRAFSDAERERIQAIRDLTYTTWEWTSGARRATA
jgi:lipoate-protein ligase A